MHCATLGSEQKGWCARRMKHDWEAMRLDYVTSLKSYSQISEEHQVARTLIGRRARAENWPAQRVQYRQQVARGALKKQGSKDTRQLAALMDAAELMSYQVLDLLNDEEQFNRYFDSGYVKDDMGRMQHVHHDFTSEKVDTKALSNAAKALADMTRTMRNLYALPDYQDKEKARQEKRRIKLLEEKRTGIADGDCGVVEMPGILPEDPNALEVE